MRLFTAMTAIALAAAEALLGVACTSARSAGPGDPYLTDAAYRRSELVASLVNPSNGYSQIRLARYEAGGADDWSALPEWNPRVDVVAASELDAAGGAHENAPLGPDARALSIGDDAKTASPDALLALGEDAFFRYPVELAPNTGAATPSRDLAARYGLWVDAARGVGGLVRAELANGDRAFAYTCATCHAAVRDGVGLVVGVGNDRLDLGRLAADTTNPDPVLAARLLGWGPGRVDVTSAVGVEPVRIPDLRPTRWLTHLHHDATVQKKSRASLAIRLETLIIASHGQVLRPPREVTLGLAAYLESLASKLPTRDPATDAERHGSALFAATCARCHAPPGFTGPPVALDVVGTDPSLGLSLDRGTGTYRVPSLAGVATRGPLLHDASLPGLDAMLDPARVGPTYAGGRHGPGAVPGHVFGLDLDTASRADLLAYLSTL